MNRPYCSLLDIFDDLEIDGTRFVDKPLRFIRAASQVIDRRGRFIAETESRTFDGYGQRTLWIDSLVELISLEVDGRTLSTDDYFLMPFNRHWTLGPYNSLELRDLSSWSSNRATVVITGRWSLYDDAIDLGTTVVQNATVSTVEVSTAAQISPGVVLLLDDEQEVVEAYAAPLTVGTLRLTETISDSQNDFNISDGSLIQVNEIIRLEHEQLRVQSLNGNSCSALRGWNGTQRQEHSANTALEAYRLFNVTRAVNGTSAAAHNTADVLRVLPPYDIRYLTEQIAALMIKKSQTGFAGKTGNPETGEVFYNQEFPKDPLERIMKNYRIVSL